MQMNWNRTLTDMYSISLDYFALVLVNNCVSRRVLAMLRYQIYCICKLYQHTF